MAEEIWPAILLVIGILMLPAAILTALLASSQAAIPIVFVGLILLGLRSDLMDFDDSKQ